MSKLRNLKFVDFYAGTPKQRFELIRRERKTGSVSPEIYKELTRLTAAGKLKLLERTTVVSFENMPDENLWKLGCQTAPQLEQINVEADVVILATGTDFCLSGNSILGKFNSECPIQNFEGLPLLTQNLQWNADIPLLLWALMLLWKLAQMR